MQNNKHELICVDCEGNENRFLYSIEKSEDQGCVKWIFRVIPDDKKATDWYEFAVTQIDESIGKVTVMNNRDMIQYRGKGITEKLISESSLVLGLTIISSTSVQIGKSLENEWRTEPATKIWERLRVKGNASHDTITDIYTYLK